MVLLGAGASADAGIPTSMEMTQRVVEDLNQSHGLEPMVDALNFVCAQIVGHDGRSGKSPYSSIDVERLFAAIRLLDERETLEVAPFVTWHPSVTASRQRRFGAGHEARALDDEIRNMMRSSGMRSFGSRAASIIRDIAQAEIALAATTDIYSVLASAVLLCLRRHVRPVTEPTYLDDLRGHR
jgi:hypothetical protein